MSRRPRFFLDFQPIWKAVSSFFLVVVIIIWAFFVSSCSSTVHPARVEAVSIAYDGNSQNAGVLKTWPNGGALLTEAKKAEYDALARRYANGVVMFRLVPPIDPVRGLTRLAGKDEGFPEFEHVWRMDAQALTDFILVKEWFREGRTPF
jgi:hypothetical protein